MPDAELALRLTQVSKRFSSNARTVQALQNISFDVPTASISGLIGPDGAGKTTLMRLAAGLLQADSGHIVVCGHELADAARQTRSPLAYMPQRFGLYEDLSVQENLELYTALQGLPTDACASRYETLLHMTGLAPFLRRLAGRLSGGMKQKLGLACVLVRTPRLLLLDEPTVGVDPVSRRELWAIVDHLVVDTGMAVLLSTAYLDEAERCAKVILLHEGRVLGQGTPNDFSAELNGRCFLVPAAEHRRRRLHARLSRTSGVVDASLQADGVRIVLDEPRGHLADRPELKLQPVAARFEDAFVSLLRAKTQVIMAPTQSAPSVRATAEAVIEVHGLYRSFGDFVAVRNLDFTVRQGEVFGLLGANGAGKSTTFRMLCGLLPPSSGKLSVVGHDLAKAAAVARSRIGYMAQKFSLYGNLSVLQNLRFFSAAYGLFGSRRRQRVACALDNVDLRNTANTASDQLPPGYQQRLALACALLHEPEILFLDEPTSGVDPLTRREFWLHINALAESGVTVLITTHFMEEAEYCDRLAIMAEGSLLALGTPAAIRKQADQPSLEEAFVALIQHRETHAEPT